MNQIKHSIGKWIGYLLFILPLPTAVYTVYRLLQTTFLSVYGALLIILLSTIPIVIGAVLLIKYKPEDKRQPFLRRLEIVLFFVYLILLYIVLFRSDRIADSVKQMPFEQYVKLYSNFVPFQGIIVYGKYIYYQTIFSSMAVSNIAGNILLFMPMGFFLPILWKPLFKWRFFLPAMFILLLSVESIQLFARLGKFDVDDIILNLTGATITYACIKGKDMQLLLHSLYLVK